MRKFLISAAVVASTVAIASPAAAQWAPSAPQGYGYGYQNNYGQNNYGQTRRLEVRIQQVRNQIRQLDRRNSLSSREANRLDAEARSLQYRVRQLGYNGLNQRERYDIERRIARLEQNIRYQANDGNRYSQNGYGSGYGYNSYNNGYSGYVDRDRDGRDDGNEHDRWHNQHEDGDRDDD